MEEDGRFGLDLVALNVQRGRDHGIPGYVEYRKICQVGPSDSFNDLRTNIASEVFFYLQPNTKRLFKRECIFLWAFVIALVRLLTSADFAFLFMVSDPYVL